MGMSFMGLYDRDYTQYDYDGGHEYRPQMRLRLPRPSTVVGWLMAINFAVFLIGAIFFRATRDVGGMKLTFLEQWFSVYPYSVGSALQIWRLITYQFLHGNALHILLNMLWLYFLGPTLERHWGGKKFLKFYLGCGVAGGIFYLLLVAAGILGAGPMVGASGAILGLFAACAILFPRFNVFLIPFPVAIPIRVAAIGGIVIYLWFVVTRGENAGGHAAHLAGMVAGAVYVLSQSWGAQFKSRFQHRFGEKRKMSEFNLQADLDNILDKVHRSGIHSLTRREKRVLKQATELERKRNRL